MTPSETTTAEFLIRIKPSERCFTASAGETLLAAAIRQGVGLPYGCKDGACGSCKCKKLSGVVQHGAHQSKALSDEEEAAGMVLTCCAAALSDVVLEPVATSNDSAGSIPARWRNPRTGASSRAATCTWWGARRA